MSEACGCAGPLLNITSTRAAPDVVVMSVAGEVDMNTAASLGHAVVAQLAQRPRMLVLDLSQVTFLGAAGLTVLDAASRTAAEQHPGQHGGGRDVVLGLVGTRPSRNNNGQSR